MGLSVDRLLRGLLNSASERDTTLGGASDIVARGLAAFAATIAILLVSGLRVAEAQQPTRIIEGIVVNATPGGRDVSGQVVTLHRVSATDFDDITTTTDDAGAFRFEGILYDPALSYGVSVRYQEAIYGTDLDLRAGSPAPVVLTVYDATHDDTIISAAASSMLLAAADGSDQTLAALEIVTLANRSDRAYVPGSGVMELLRFGLPPGATDLSLDTQLIGADFVQVDRGFALLASVPPGEHEIMFSYRFPYDASQFTLRKSYRYGADSLRILAPDEVVSISSDTLGPPGPEIIGERQYQVIKAEGLTRGATVALKLEGLPVASAGQRLGNRIRDIKFEYAAFIGLIVLMLGLLAYGGIRRSGRSRLVEPVSTDPDERVVIHRMIDDLSRSYETGSLSEADYRQRLSVLNSRLTALRRTGPG